MLMELHLDGVIISSSDWCLALSSSTPHLRVLSLRNCNISAALGPLLLNLHFHSVINLKGNNLSTTVPEFLANFTKLTSLSLSYCNLQGEFPNNIFQVPTLEYLDFSSNQHLTGNLPDEFPQNVSLRQVFLSYTSFVGSLPDSIVNLSTLTRLDLSACNFSGTIPSTIEDLTGYFI
ncbi:receptor-like protein 7 [Lycium barbarum]|uniref:receptor-like protein 7 n=1 Tax=Lycium barbarum TaxID=112863 RepID=UPI00293F380D|nr:receptor-like protein 7 [Lycium barbarum]